MNTKLEKLVGFYLLIFGVIMLIFVMHWTPNPVGEWDDYSLVTASIINEHNISITSSDVNKAKELFPEWSKYLDNYSLSGYKTRAGGEMAWYFATYSAACVPALLILYILKIPAIYAFSLTNLFFLMLALYICYKKSKLTLEYKSLLILFLSVNPIIFYLPWISAEVFIYSMIVMGMLFWINEEYHKAAIAISIAGTLNPTILFAGIIMILDYLVKLAKENRADSIYKMVSIWLKNWKKILIYGSCYIIALIPLAYNYYNVGKINLTAANEMFTKSNTSVWQRFIAYIFDLNFGILPYYCFIFLISIILFILAVYKKCIKYIILVASFFGIVFAYSFMVHINCGMSGIARYNAWSAVILIFAVINFLPMLVKVKYQRIAQAFIIINSCIMGLIIYDFGPMCSSNYSYTTMTPIASAVLNNIPQLYNPLASTFNSRINHLDGGYSYQLPIYYCDEQGNVRKILLSKDTVDSVKNELWGNKQDIFWLQKQLNHVKNEQYISIGKKHSLYKYPIYSVGSTIWFKGNKWNASNYITNGISMNETNYTWTNGKVLDMRLKINNYSITDNYSMAINIAGVFNNKQNVKITANNVMVYNDTITGVEKIEFSFKPLKNGMVNIRINMPDAISPKQLNISNDNRILALQLDSAIIKKGK